MTTESDCIKEELRANFLNEDLTYDINPDDLVEYFRIHDLFQVEWVAEVLDKNVDAKEDQDVINSYFRCLAFIVQGSSAGHSIRLNIARCIHDISGTFLNIVQQEHDNPNYRFNPKEIVYPPIGWIMDIAPSLYHEIVENQNILSGFGDADSVVD